MENPNDDSITIMQEAQLDNSTEAPAETDAGESANSAPDIATQEQTDSAETLPSEKTMKALMEMYGERDLFDPFMGETAAAQPFAEEIREAFGSMTAEEQSEVAEKFFNETIGKAIMNNRGAYKVYGMLKGTPFANKFKELESDRLTSAGYTPLSL
jgi:hypothetical protein